LLTKAHGEPSLGPELRAEIDTSDVVDLICAFVKWYGLRLLEPELRRLRLREAPFRVITTTYLGATDRLALDRLVNDFGAEVKVQCDVLRTRLHAKAWPARAHASQPAIIPVLADGVPSRSIVFGPDVISSYGPAQMVAQLAAPNAQYLHLIAEDGVAEHLVVLGDDSYAVFTGEPGNWAVRQEGPEQLWDKVEDALAKWHASGEPNLDTFQITVTPDRQVIDVAGWTGVLPTLDLRYPDKDGQ